MSGSSLLLLGALKTAGKMRFFSSGSNDFTARALENAKKIAAERYPDLHSYFENNPDITMVPPVQTLKKFGVTPADFARIFYGEQRVVPKNGPRRFHV